ncbi:MAG: RsmE family RNA methyltransferase [Gemmatimonadaceae bacterium]
MVERADRAAVSTFYAPGVWGARAELDEAAAHHAGVKRLAIGDPVRLTSGDGRRSAGHVAALAKRKLIIALDGPVERVAPLPRVELWAPVGDRDRMLLLAEKAVELGASAWRPIVYRRSRSVNPRGEGDAFREKLRLRMISALEQSGSAWLPASEPEAPLDAALAAGRAVDGILLDAGGAPLGALDGGLRAPIAIALGPEGGLDLDERAAFVAAGWRPASLGANVLRFETAGIAALAVVRSLMIDQ